MATRYIDIPIFSGGLVTNADLEDIPKDAASATSNMDLDVYGKLKKRKPRSLSYTVTGSQFKQLLHWVTPSGSDHWIGYETQNNNVEFWTTNFQKKHGELTPGLLSMMLGEGIIARKYKYRIRGNY